MGHSAIFRRGASGAADGLAGNNGEHFRKALLAVGELAGKLAAKES
jgi:hypothetical protein